MPARWAAAAFLATEENFRGVMGYRDLWALKAILRGKQELKRNRQWRKMLTPAVNTFNCVRATIPIPKHSLHVPSPRHSGQLF